MRRLAAALLLLAAPAAAGELQPFGRGSWAELRRSHAGHATIVHFWGLTCGPCLVELPEWGKLARERRGADVVMVAADPYPMPGGTLMRTLDRDGLAGVQNWVFDGFSERLRFEVDPDWQGELPYTVLLGPDGTAHAFDGAADLAALRTWLDHPAAMPAAAAADP